MAQTQRQERRPQHGAPAAKRIQRSTADVAQRNDSTRATVRVDSIKPKRKRSFPWVLLLFPAIALAIASIVFGAESCSRQEEIVAEQVELTARERAEVLYRNYYTWTNILTDSHGRYVYKTSATTVLSRIGIDVSQHQADIDWAAVAEDGIEFAIIRAGYRTSDRGTILKDERFEQNYAGASNNGLDVGVYFFSQATTEDEAREEADFVLSLLGDRKIDYPIVFDLEPASDGSDRVAGMGIEELTAVARAFCDRIQEAGHEAMIYGNRTDLARYNLTELVDYSLWYAEYDKHPTMDLRFVMWQYSRTGSVAGIEGNVDLDIDLSAALADIEEREAAKAAEEAESEAAAEAAEAEAAEAEAANAD